jgi:spore coat protein A, manganese oxidase
VLKNDAFVVMQFRVSAGKVTDTSSLPSTLRPVPKIPESRAVQTRLLTLDEYVNKAGNPVMLLLNALIGRCQSRRGRCWDRLKSGR